MMNTETLVLIQTNNSEGSLTLIQHLSALSFLLSGPRVFLLEMEGRDENGLHY